jgi:type II secretory pathway component GspD/PulD (secretin)
MKFELKLLAAAMATTTILTGCSVTPFSEEEKNQPLQVSPTSLEVERSATYLREVTPEEAFLKRRINVSGTLPLVDVLRKQLSDVAIVPGDQNVELGKPVQIFAQDMYVEDFLNYLESVTGYDLDLRNGVLTIRSFVQKEWNLAAFASKRAVKLKVGSTLKQGATQGSGGGSGGAEEDNSIQGSFNDDEWSIIVDSARQMLGAKVSAQSGDVAGIQKPFVHAVRSVGTLNVGGPAARVKALDAFVTSLKDQGMRQVNINVQAYDVSLKDNRGFGIDWNELSSVAGSINGNPLDISISNKPATNSVIPEADRIFNTSIKYQSDSIKADALVNFLSTYGDVELLNQPNVTVRNGTYAYISTGEEFSFVGEITRESQLNGTSVVNVSTSQEVTAVKIESVRIGVTLAVTPRILDDGRIMLDIWPVISSQSGSDNFTVADDVFTNPRIALNELSTEVITESGKPIQLGGFITKSIEKKLQELPWKDRITNALVNPIFRSEKNDLERRELVLTVTPTIVDGV